VHRLPAGPLEPVAPRPARPTRPHHHPRHSLRAGASVASPRLRRLDGPRLRHDHWRRTTGPRRCSRDRRAPCQRG
jgi:hypothetical protein